MIRDLSERLAAEGLALENLGDIDVQTVVGRDLDRDARHGGALPEHLEPGRGGRAGDRRRVGGRVLARVRPGPVARGARRPRQPRRDRGADVPRGARLHDPPPRPPAAAGGGARAASTSSRRATTTSSSTCSRTRASALCRESQARRRAARAARPRGASTCWRPAREQRARAVLPDRQALPVAHPGDQPADRAHARRVGEDGRELQGVLHDADRCASPRWSTRSRGPTARRRCAACST